MKRVFQLRLIWNRTREEVVNLSNPGELLIGSDEQADIQIPENQANCIIRMDEQQQCYIQQCGAAAARLNGRLVDGCRRLFSGDMIQLGYITLMFLVVSTRQEAFAHA